MKTIHEYEPADIDLKSADGVTGFLFGQILIIALTGFKEQDGDPKDDPTYPFKRAVAQFLNAAQKSGITIAKGEAVPDVFSR